jgi:hypothetical protein
VYRKYKASVEMSAGGRVYTEDSGPVERIEETDHTTRVGIHRQKILYEI